ncbi:ShlB/FhaC/HecB family hemolysin secretion/activation protein [Gloeocapsa sp. PCC 73106]|uniref:ShlB/FhaC/HecB family hemolysin secretion/activation protein n=1 Tax=Gloeocapsa sp. PCC 73106 TaxID=102232 RepID=UPI0002AC86BC|nr:ShlB/FhaC/HecB family hemolysin secretion/activation protein [Gloeocapsa sp. PCC 73106]ELR96339.1 hemolysin activation/secretion protein [Gloeocapsa sp. PCC 73106]
MTTSVFLYLAVIILGAFYSPTVLAQIPPQRDPVRPEFPEEVPKPLETPELQLPPRPTPPSPPEEVIPGSGVKVTGFEFTGNTAFSEAELQEVLQDFLGLEISFADLVQIERIITELYFNNGYINSQAIIEADQIFPQAGGVIVVTIIEGGVEEIIVNGTRRLKADYIRSRLGLAVQTPLNQNRLLRALQLLQLNPLIENISAQLSAGVQPNSSVLEVEIKEADSLDIDIFANNGRNASVGSFRRGFHLGEGNLFGFGDRVDLTYTNTNGSNTVDFSYEIPVSPRNTSIRLAGGYSTSEIVDRLFNELDITGNYYYYEASVRHPIFQTPSQEFALGLTLSRQESKNFLLGERFPIAVGADESGEIKISAIRFFQDYVKRNAVEVIAFNSELSFGVDVFDASNNPEGIPDSNFVTWRTQGQYVRIVPLNALLVIRSDLQLSSARLVGLEQLSIGGLGSVRGYPQDFVLTDNGFVLTSEVRIPVWRLARDQGILSIVPFVDFGIGWNHGDAPNPDPNALVGIGAGVLWQMGERLAARFDWGIPLVSSDNEGKSLNSQGLYFSLDVRF